MTPVLEVIDLGVAFGGIRAVDGVSFAAERNGPESRRCSI
jgi:ABC-type branched-subunit amino acid transport system ATPase component